MSAYPGEDNPVCQECGLHSGCRTPFMEGSGPFPTYDVNRTENAPGLEPEGCILVVGESPGETEDAHGRPFIGRSGAILRKTLKTAGLPAKRIRFTNAVRCHPGGNKTPTGAVQHCRGFLEAEIDELKPEAIIVCGNSALLSLCRTSGITKKRRRRFEYTSKKHTCPIFPSLHPAAVLYDRNQTERFQDDMEFISQSIAGKTSKLKVPVENLDASATDVSRFHERLLKSGLTLSVDTETTTLRPFRNPDFLLLCVSLSDGRESLVVRLDRLVTAPDAGEVEVKGERYRIERASQEKLLQIRKLLEDARIPKSNHNIKYDAHILKARSAIHMENIADDTLLLHSMLYPIDGGHDLTTLVVDILGAEPYDVGVKQATEGARDSMLWALIDSDKLAEYASLDAYAAAKSLYAMQKKLRLEDKRHKNRKEQGIVPSAFYRTVIMPAMRNFLRIERDGFAVDLDYAHQLDSEVLERIDEVKAQIRRFRTVRKFERARIGEAMKTVAAMKRPSDTSYLRALEKARFSMDSPKQIAEILYDEAYYGARAQKETESGALSTDKETLELIRANDPNEAVGVFCEALLGYRELAKFRSTYVNSNIENTASDGRVHSTFNVAAARTGRISSSDPNLQNQPKTKDIRDVFIAAPGCVLVELDYSQIELRVAAAYSQDENMIASFVAGRDIHRDTAIKVFGVEDPTDDQRSRSKQTNFGVLYGLGAPGLSRNAGIPIEEAEEFIETYYETFPAIRTWQERVKRFAIKNGYVTTMFGTKRALKNAQISPRESAPDERRKLSEALREAVNTPIQGTAAYICLVSLNVLSECLRKLPFLCRIVCQVHDSIVLEILAEKVDGACAMAKTIMQDEPRKWIGDRFGPIPIEVDVKVGSRWGSMEPWKQ